MKKALSILLAGAMLTSMVTTGCSNNVEAPSDSSSSSKKDVGETSDTKDEKVKLTFATIWQESEIPNSGEVATFYSMIDKFKAENPNVELEMIAMAPDDYEVKIQAQAAGDDLPDIMNVKGSWAGNFVESGLIADMKEAIDKSGWVDQYRPGVFQPVSIGEGIYGAPITFSVTSLIYYNKDMWAEIGYDAFPDNWEDIYAANEKFKEKGMNAIAIGNKAAWPYEACLLSALGDRYTGTDWTKSIIANDGVAKFTDPEFINALNHAKELADKGVWNPDFNSLTNQQASALYAQGKSPALVEGAWGLPWILENATEEIGKATRVAIVPGVTGGKGNANAVSGGSGWFYGVNSKMQGAKKDYAMKLATYLSGPEFSQGMADNYGALGACNTPFKGVENLPELTQSYIELINKSSIVPIYDALMPANIIDVMNRGLQELTIGTVSSDELAKRLQEEQEKAK